MTLQDALIVIGAYLIGSIPFSHLIAWLKAGVRLREVGEGNVGARNVWHVVGPTWGALAGALDWLKGLGALGLARILSASSGVMLLTGFAVVLGHQFPVFLRGQGGKGVATSLGFLTGLLPRSSLVGLLVFALTQLLLRDFNRSVTVGVAAVILLPPFFGYSPWMVVYALAIFLWLAVKKAIDLPHEREVWARSGWKGDARPGWYREDKAK